MEWLVIFVVAGLLEGCLEYFRHDFEGGDVTVGEGRYWRSRVR